MPYTVNGIGTMYYGKKNLEHNPGICEHCGYRGNLLSYETRLWFVVVFIPVIPLGKKQILDYCPTCRRHRMISSGEWQRIGEEVLTKKMAELSERPDDPEAIIRMHELMVAFNKKEEATKLAKVMESNFPDNVAVQMYLGAWHEKEQREEQADRCFTRALNAEPSNPYARRAVAIGCIQKGELERARELLSCMEQPGPHQEPSALFLLASAYQKKGQHNKALTIFRIIKRYFPEIAQKGKNFRRVVTASEKALGSQDSILPKTPINWRLVSVALIVSAFIAGAIFANYYLKTHQTLYIINRFPVRAAVNIPGKGEFTVTDQRIEEVTIPEGDYNISVDIENGVSENVALSINNSLIERLSRDSAFILNVGGSAVLFWEQTTYSEHPDPNDEDAYHYRLYPASRFLTLRDIDYLFEEFPETITLDGKEAIKKNRVSVLDLTPSEMFNVLQVENVSPEKFLNYAEGHLLANPSDEALLQLYSGLAVFHKMTERGVEFLRKGLSWRPIPIEWHRVYQNMYQMIGETSELFSEYDAMLEEMPEDSALLYLRGRIALRGSEGLEYYDRSIQADPANPYPWFAKAYFFASRGDFTEARDACTKAYSLKPEDEKMQDLFFYLRFALGEYEDLEKEAEEAMKQYPLDPYSLDRLLQICSARGNIDGTREAYEQFLSELKVEMPEDPYNWTGWLQMRVAYISRDFSEYTNIAKTLDNSDNALFNSYLLQTNMEEAEKIIENPEENYPGFTCLLLQLGWTLAANSGKAEFWLKNAVENFQKSFGEEQLIAQLLEHREDSVLNTADDLVLYPAQKAILYAALANLYPAERKELLARAEKLNVTIEPPYYFLEKVINTLKKN